MVRCFDNRSKCGARLPNDMIVLKAFSSLEETSTNRKNTHHEFKLTLLRLSEVWAVNNIYYIFVCYTSNKTSYEPLMRERGVWFRDRVSECVSVVVCAGGSFGQTQYMSVHFIRLQTEWDRWVYVSMYTPPQSCVSFFFRSFQFQFQFLFVFVFFFFAFSSWGFLSFNKMCMFMLLFFASFTPIFLFLFNTPANVMWNVNVYQYISRLMVLHKVYDWFTLKWKRNHSL